MPADFLQIDREVRKAHGVYTTPKPLTRWMVRSVDALLRDALAWPEGLRDPRVRLLDPAAGPFNFVLEAYRQEVARHRRAHGRRGLETLVRDHLLPRFQGIEILPEIWAAGLEAAAQRLERLGVAEPVVPLFLADSLAGPALPGSWAEGPNVILGNPPFNGRPGPASPWMAELLRDYFSIDGQPLGERNTKWLHDDYVKFLRFAQWRLEKREEGVLAFVVNHNAFEAPTFRGLRHSLLGTFQRIYALDLHGNRRKRETGPSGERDENVFPGVAQGVGVLLLVRRPGLPRRVFRGDLYGTRSQKLATLARTTAQTFPWTEISVEAPRYLLRGTAVERRREYQRGLSLPELFPLHSLGVVTGQDSRFVALDRESLEAGLPLSRRRRVTSFLARPFDLRHVLFEEQALARPRRAVMKHLRPGGNLALLALRQALPEPGAFVTRWVTGHKVVSPYSPNAVFPLYRAEGVGPPVPNLEPGLLSSLTGRFGEAVTPEDLLGWVYATLHDSRFLSRFGEEMRTDFPRIPLPGDDGPFFRRAGLGRELIAAHLLEHPRLAAMAGCVLTGDPRTSLAFPRYDEPAGRIRLNGEGLAFEGIEPEPWRHRIGGYRVLPTWLRARAGRVLRPAHVRSFRRIVAALRLSRELQALLENHQPEP